MQNFLIAYYFHIQSSALLTLTFSTIFCSRFAKKYRYWTSFVALIRDFLNLLILFKYTLKVIISLGIKVQAKSYRDIILLYTLVNR